MPKDDAMPQTYTRKSEFLAGMKATIPLEVGAIPFGIIFGAVATAGGISPAGTMGMSLFVFAGSAQFIGAGLYAQGVGIAIIVLTTFIVNLRHALYSASLAPYMKHLSQKWLMLLGFWLTDESFVVVILRYHEPDNSPHKHWFFFGSALFMYVNWNLCTLIGIIAGQQIKNADQWGLDFALVVTFIGLVVPIIRTRPVLVSVVVAGATALLTYNVPNKLGLLIAALLGIAAGMIAESMQPSASPDKTTETQRTQS
jgi:4-azaleucine resistance transporter AzlC